MKMKNVVLGLLVIGSLTMVGCDDIEDTSSSIDDNKQTTEQEVERSEDYTKGGKDFQLDYDNGTVVLQNVAVTAVEYFNAGEITEFNEYFDGYLDSLYDNGGIEMGRNKVRLTRAEAEEQLLFTSGSLPSYSGNDLETKKKCAIGALKNLIGWDYNIDKDTISFQENTTVDGKIYFFIMQGNANVGRAAYDTNTGDVGYEVNSR